MQRSNQLRPVDPVRDSAPQPGVRRLREVCSTAGLAAVLFVGGSLGGSVLGIAHAQSSPKQLAEANQTAMEAYNNLDIEAARAQLEKSAKGAEKNGIRGPALARTYSNLAVVLVGGLGDMKGATAAFARALKEDPKVEPDPIVATPEVMQAYNSAKASKSAPADEELEEAPTPAPVAKRDPSAPIEGNLDHTPAVEQLSQTAVPVFVKKSDDLEIDSIKVFYRSLGMKKPKAAEMSETDDGYTFLIPCADVFEPVVEYFIVATNAEGETIGNSGTAEAPIAVPIVGERTEPAPSLPGQVPPATCSADDECPPGMPGCGGSAGLGDTCSSDNDCASGLICEDDFCSSGEREASDDDDADDSSSSSSASYKKFFVDLNFGVGATAIGKGKAPDRASLATINEVAGISGDGMGGYDLVRADEQLQLRGFDCDPSQVETPMGARLSVKECTVAVRKGGLIGVPLLNIAIGYYVTPRLALALTGRIQIGAGEGPLAGILIGGRGEYLLSKPSDRGLRFGLLGGFGIGTMQARPTSDNVVRKGPYATNGDIGGVGFVVNLGVRAGYRLTKNFGLNFTPAMNFGFPNFLFALDLTAGVELAF